MGILPNRKRVRITARPVKKVRKGKPGTLAFMSNVLDTNDSPVRIGLTVSTVAFLSVESKFLPKFLRLHVSN